MQRFIHTDEIQLLESLVGCQVGYFGGPFMTAEAVTADLVIFTEQRNVEIFGDVESLPYFGEQDDFSKFVIRVASEELLSKTEASGNFFLQCRGQVIRDIKFVEEDTFATIDGEGNWADTCIVSIVLILDESVLAISKMSHHLEAIQVKNIPGINILSEIPQLDIRFDEDVVSKIRTTRRLLSLDQLKELSK